MHLILVIPTLFMKLLIILIMEVEEGAVEEAEARVNVKYVLRMVILKLWAITDSMQTMFQDLHKILLGMLLLGQGKAVLILLRLRLIFSSGHLQGMLIPLSQIHCSGIPHLLGNNSLLLSHLGSLLCLHSSGVHLQFHIPGLLPNGHLLSNPGLPINGMLSLLLHLLQGLSLDQFPSSHLSLIL